MAYMGRGGFSSFRGGNNGESGTNNENTNRNIYNRRRYYRGGIFRIYYYIPFDNTYVIFQIISSIIIFAIAGITFLATYKPSVIDPIEQTKRTILNTYILIIISLVVITLLAHYFSKDKKTLIKKLFAILAISIITIFTFLGIKSNLNSTYTKSKFEQIYTQENGEQTSSAKSKIDIGITGMKIKTEKEYYVDECMKAYNIFGVRMYVVMGLNILIIMLLIYQIIKVSQIQEKREKLNKNDAILFDEEENIKF